MKNPYRELSSLNPQKENGHREINNTNFSALIASRFSGSEMQLVLTIIDKTWGFGKEYDSISYSQFQKATSLSRQSISVGLKSLETKGVIVISREEMVNQYMFNKFSDTWLTSHVNHTSQANHTKTSQPNHTKTSQPPRYQQKKLLKKKESTGTTNSLFQELLKLPGWGNTPLKEDRLWLAEFLEEFPLEVSHIRGCRDFHSSKKGVHTVGQWKTWLRNWMTSNAKFEVRDKPETEKLGAVVW